MRKLANFLPYVITLLTVMNTVVQHRTGIPMYIGAAALGLAAIASLGGGAQRVVWLPATRPFLMFVAWLGVVFVGETITGTLFGESQLAMKSLFHATWTPMFWVLFAPNAVDFDWQRFVKFCICLGVIVGILGFLQRFYSLNLWGNLPDVKWSEHFTANANRFRVTSVLSSPQVFGLYCTVLAAFAFSRSLRWATWLKNGVAILFVSAAFLSGNKGVLALLMLFAVLRTRIPAKPFLVSCGVVVVLMMLIFSPTIQSRAHRIEEQEDVWTRSIAWVLNIRGLVQKEQEGRLLIYQTIVEKTNPVVGLGMGCTAASEGQRGVVPESHLLLLYAEAGFPAVVFFCYFLWECWRSAKSRGDEGQVFLIWLVAGASVFVHAISYPGFFCIWGLIIGHIGGRSGRSVGADLRQGEFVPGYASFGRGES